MDRFEFILAEPDPCELTLRKAAQHYKQPLSDLKLKAPLHVQYAAEEREETLGDFVANVPRPGDVAMCLGQQKKSRRVMHAIW